MSSDDAIQFSRIEATARSLAGFSTDSHQFLDKKVLLTGESEILATANGQRCFLDCVRLLMRMIRSLTIRLPDASPLATEVDALVRKLTLGSPPVIERSSMGGLANFDAILSVGVSGRADLPWTVLNSNGWLARVSSKGRSLSNACSSDNPIGALGAACLGVAEVFKRLIRLKPDRGELHDLLSFSFYTYSVDDSPGPPLPKTLQVDLLLVGAGAIGNGTVHLLRELPTTGRVAIVDHQTFGEENWGTSILVSPDDFGTPKAVAAERWMAENCDAKGFPEKIEDFQIRCNNDKKYPRLIINGLDKVSPRRTVQDFWPDQIVDGAISATACEVTLHPWGPDLSCLKCDFEEPTVSAESVQASATGLRRERLANPQDVITEEDVQSAPPEKQDWLRQRKGKQVCSVVSEGVLSQIAADAQPAGFQPSVPFVACLSSCMIVAELVRFLQGEPPALETGFQFDVMIGPQRGQHKAHGRKADCICVTRKTNIELLRQRRFS